MTSSLTTEQLQLQVTELSIELQAAQERSKTLELVSKRMEEERDRFQRSLVRATPRARGSFTYERDRGGAPIGLLRVDIARILEFENISDTHLQLAARDVILPRLFGGEEKRFYAIPHGWRSLLTIRPLSPGYRYGTVMTRPGKQEHFLKALESLPKGDLVTDAVRARSVILS